MGPSVLDLPKTDQKRFMGWFGLHGRSANPPAALLASWLARYAPEEKQMA